MAKNCAIGAAAVAQIASPQLISQSVVVSRQTKFLPCGHKIVIDCDAFFSPVAERSTIHIGIVPSIVSSLISMEKYTSTKCSVKCTSDSRAHHARSLSKRTTFSLGELKYHFVGRTIHLLCRNHVSPPSHESKLATRNSQRELLQHQLAARVIDTMCAL